MLWHSLLKATGSNLVPEKCFWYLIDFKYKHNCWHYQQWPVANNQLQIAKDSRTMVMIPHLQTNEARMTLGVWLAPDGNNDEEYKHLLGKANLWKKTHGDGKNSAHSSRL